MSPTIEIEYGAVMGPLLRIFGPALVGGLGIFLIAFSVYALPVAIKSSWDMRVALAFFPFLGAWFLAWGYLGYRTRHAFVTKYSLNEDGIEVAPSDEIAQLVPWSDFNRVIIRRLFWTIELNSPRLRRPAVITLADGDPSHTRFDAARAMILDKLGHVVESRFV
jgi:hypothetical protein